MPESKKPVKDNLKPDFSIEADTIISRYMSVEQFLAIGESKTLTLPKIKCWEDPNESYEVRQFYDANIRCHQKKGEQETALILEKQKNDLLERAFGICFTKTTESDAHWRIFSKQGTGIQISTNVRKLEDAMQNSNIYCLYAVGKVFYGTLEYAPNLVDGMSLSIHAHLKKDVPFENENEVRLVAVFILESGNRFPDLITIPIDSGFFSCIVIDPRAKKWEVAALKSYCRSKEWLKSIPVEQSQLYKKVEDRSEE
ncbi:MAG: hypothetical protein HZA04_01095 [Nitrospinae bacterium]|nr:hypothetical protein [Nitrospinota bacterium]